MKKALRIISACLAVITLVSVFAIAPSADKKNVTNEAIAAKRNEISGLQSLLNEKKSESETARKKIEEIKNNIEKTEEKKTELLEKIKVLNDQIDTTEEIIDKYSEYISLKEEEIAATAKELDNYEKELVEFLRYDYESGSQTLKTVEFLLNSASLSDFMSNIHYIGTLMDYQDHLIETMQNTITKYEGQKLELQSARDEKQLYMAELEDEVKESNEYMDEAIAYIIQLEAEQTEYEAAQASAEEEEASLSEAIKKAQKEEEELVKEEEERIRKEEEERKRKEEEERRKKEAEEAAKRQKELEEKAKQAQIDAENKKKLEEEAEKLANESKSYSNSGNYMWPLPMNSFRISGWFGYEPHPLRSGLRFHKAVDLAAPSGTSIYAAASGKVITAKYSSSYGYYVVILHSNGYSTLYAHASKLLVKAGAYVTQGDVIAKVGTTGSSTGNHLHFEIILPDGETRQDPMYYFKSIYNAHKNDSPRYDNLNNPRKTTYKP